MCFNSSGGGPATTEDKPYDFSKWTVKSFKKGEEKDGTFGSLFYDAPPPPSAQKAANYNEDMGITDPNDPYAVLAENTKTKSEALPEDDSTSTDKFKKKQKKTDSTVEQSQGGFLNIYKG